MARTLVAITDSWQSLGTGPMVVSVQVVVSGVLMVNSAENEATAESVNQNNAVGVQFDCRAAVEYFAKATVATGWKVITDDET